MTTSSDLSKVVFLEPLLLFPKSWHKHSMDIKEIRELQKKKKNQENTWKEHVFPMNKIRKAVSLLQVKHIKQEGDMLQN